jgi:hypothetical protein
LAASEAAAVDRLDLAEVVLLAVKLVGEHQDAELGGLGRGRGRSPMLVGAGLLRLEQPLLGVGEVVARNAMLPFLPSTIAIHCSQLSR